MLQFDPIKNVAKVMRFFDVQAKQVKTQFEAVELEEKKKGLDELCNIFGNTKTFKE